MKKIIITLITIIFVGCNSDKDNSIKEMNLKGNIKSIKEIYFDGNEKFGEYVKEEWKYTIDYSFNEDGNIIERNSYYAPKNSIRDKTKYLYNDKNQIFEENKYDSSGNLESTYKYNYDEIGNKTEKISIQHNKIVSTEKYIYDNKGKLQEMQYVLLDGSITLSEKYKYDINGLLIEKIEYCYGCGYDESEVSSVINRYNNKGQLIEICNANSNSTSVKRIYDNNGEKIKQINYYDDGTPNGDEFTTKIKYDEKGNWIHKTIIGTVNLFNETPSIRIEEREIEYY